MKWDKASAEKMAKQHQGNIVKGAQIGVSRAGIKVWGAIDYLCSKHNYRWYRL